MKYPCRAFPGFPFRCSRHPSSSFRAFFEDERRDFRGSSSNTAIFEDEQGCTTIRIILIPAVVSGYCAVESIENR